MRSQYSESGADTQKTKSGVETEPQLIYPRKHHKFILSTYYIHDEVADEEDMVLLIKNYLSQIVEDLSGLKDTIKYLEYLQAPKSSNKLSCLRTAYFLPYSYQ